MAVSKVTLNGTTLMDATSATATASEIISPYTAMTADGVMTTGTGSSGSGWTADGIADGSEPNGAITITYNGTIKNYAFAGCTGITSINAPNLTRLAERAFEGCTNLTSVSLPSVTGGGSYVFRNCSSLTSIILPSMTSTGGNFFNSSSIPIIVYPNVTKISINGINSWTGHTVDLGSTCTALDGYAFNSSANLSTLILRRSTAIVTMGNLSAMSSTKFKSGGEGGTIYIPKALYDHLGDGTALDYKSASNWSTFEGYGTITWAKIEGSYYETHYADGTPIS